MPNVPGLVDYSNIIMPEVIPGLVDSLSSLMSDGISGLTYS